MDCQSPGRVHALNGIIYGVRTHYSVTARTSSYTQRIRHPWWFRADVAISLLQLAMDLYHRPITSSDASSVDAQVLASPSAMT